MAGILGQEYEVSRVMAEQMTAEWRAIADSAAIWGTKGSRGESGLI
jgi:hypothetical protein